MKYLIKLFSKMIYLNPSTRMCLVYWSWKGFSLLLLCPFFPGKNYYYWRNEADIMEAICLPFYLATTYEILLCITAENHLNYDENTIRSRFVLYLLNLLAFSLWKPRDFKNKRSFPFAWSANGIQVFMIFYNWVKLPLFRFYLARLVDSSKKKLFVKLQFMVHFKTLLSTFSKSAFLPGLLETA